MTLRPKLASAALKEKVADLLGMDMLEAAYGVYTVANTTMNRAIRAVSTYRGRDPRSLSEKQCSKRYASLVECKDANYSTTKSRLL